ncbi:MAG: DUF4168 domain-containing protein [Leptolyngbyaceae cyanobacterium]
MAGKSDRGFWQAVILVCCTALLWFGLQGVAPVMAQELSPKVAPDKQVPEVQVAPARLTLDPSSIPSEKVSQFVHACTQVVALIERREGELQGSETESESVRIEQEIETEALRIIEQAGLTRQEYLQLLGLANTDPEFGERIAILLQEANT